jgi:flagellar hook-associated protein 3 FlgL
VFGNPGDPNNVFKVMKDIQIALDKSDFANLTNNIGRLDKGLDKFLEARADVGAKSNRIDLILNRIKDTGTNLTSMQSKVEDADIPMVITNLKTDQNVYQSSLEVGAKLISPSLIDFLR